MSRPEVIGSDRYRLTISLKLLGIADSWHPGGGWSFVRYVPRLTVQECFEMRGWSAADMLASIENAIPASRYQFLQRLAEQIDEERRPFNAHVFAVNEQRIIEAVAAKRELDGGGGSVIGHRDVRTAHGEALLFEGHIEDGGAIIDLSTPYDHRDGKFTNLEGCATERW